MTASSSPRLSVLLAAAALSGLAGCSGSDVSRSFGLTRDAPDEFTVTTRAPLSMPPDSNLRPPRPGASRPQEPGAANAGVATLVPGAALSANQSRGVSKGEAALLGAAGQPAPGDIRAQVDADSNLAQPGRSFVDRLLFWRSPPPPGTVVDPAAEAQRLRENAALGQPSDTGDTPIIQRKSKGFFDIF
jgi:hypothetical protein